MREKVYFLVLYILTKIVDFNFFAAIKSAHFCLFLNVIISISFFHVDIFIFRPSFILLFLLLCFLLRFLVSQARLEEFVRMIANIFSHCEGMTFFEES